MAELQVIARYTIGAGNETAVLDLLPRLVEGTRAEPGNVSFAAYRRLDDDRQVVLLERFASREAFAAHRETPHYRTVALEGIIPLLERREVELYDVVD